MNIPSGHTTVYQMGQNEADPVFYVGCISTLCPVFQGHASVPKFPSQDKGYHFPSVNTGIENLLCYRLLNIPLQIWTHFCLYSFGKDAFTGVEVRSLSMAMKFCKSQLGVHLHYPI